VAADRLLEIADLFCGAGGATTSAQRAAAQLGLRTKILAVNHWPTAVQTHTLNHPDVVHLCEAVERVDPRTKVFRDPNTGREFKNKGRLHLLLAGPECTHHARARGGRPMNDQSRATAWHVLKWAQELYIDNILIENVPEFREWGPLGANGRPLKSKKGETYQAFLAALRSLDYHVEDRVLNAADYGDPTTRKRLFIIARRGHRRPVWPVPTHSRTGGKTLFGQTKKWRGAREIIDWSIQSRSIFDPKRKAISPKTWARILAGLERFGGPDIQPFLVVLRRNATSRSLTKPLPTISAQGQHFALCEPFVMPITHGSDGSKRQRPVSDPLPTVTGANRGELALVEPFVLQQQSGGVARPVEQPLPTVACDGAISLVEPYLVPHYGERPGQPPRTHAIDEPVPAIPASGSGKFELVEPFLVDGYGGTETQPQRIQSVDEPLGVVTGSNRYEVVETSFIASYYGTQNISPVSDPLPTVTTKDRFALVLPVINGKALDIRLRMLKPHELKRAHSFGDDYRFAGNQGEQIKQIGNSWPTKLGKALIGSLMADYAASTPKKLEAIA
jgi:DNA (cytosine-5)-methyltransferase 1